MSLEGCSKVAFQSAEFESGEDGVSILLLVLDSFVPVPFRLMDRRCPAKQVNER